jgi:hypothetical protein
MSWRAKHRNAPGIPRMCLRCSLDCISPHERYSTLPAAFAPAFKGIQIDSSPNNSWGISQKPHAVLSKEFVDKPGHPTKLAREEVIRFLRERLTV